MWAQCTCGFGDGQFTLTTINVDGNIADWAPVHADLDNNVCDGPANALIDRDAPVQSTGRNLTHFAFTWDLSNIYLFTERVGSASNVQNFASDLQPAANDAVTDTIEVFVPPELLVSKSVTPAEDPFNLTVNPKAIPGADVLYTARFSNQGAGTVDADSLVITDPISSDGYLKVIDITGPGSGPVEFGDGIPSSNITYSFVSLADSTDDVSFSSDGGVTYTYTPVVNPTGCDPNVTHIRINPKGTFAADTGAGSSSAEFSFRVTVN